MFLWCHKIVTPAVNNLMAKIAGIYAIWARAKLPFGKISN